MDLLRSFDSSGRRDAEPLDGRHGRPWQAGSAWAGVQRRKRLSSVLSGVVSPFWRGGRRELTKTVRMWPKCSSTSSSTVPFQVSHAVTLVQCYCLQTEFVHHFNIVPNKAVDNIGALADLREVANARAAFTEGCIPFEWRRRLPQPG